MPKDTKKASSDKPRSNPYTKKSKPINPVKQSNDEREWDELRCPICLDPPHNPILLVCSSHEKGCRPYMCNTSPLLSNCLDQFRKSFSPEGLSCPFCRGRVISEAPPSDQALSYMNSRPRSCSKESCDFRGTHAELMEHARKDHVGETGEVAGPNTMRPVVINVRRGPRMSVGGYFPRHQLAPRTIFPRVSD